MGCGAATQLNKNEPTKKEDPPKPNAFIERRLVIAENQHKLNAVWADKLLQPGSAQELPPQASQITGWHRSNWALAEEDDGLYVAVKWHGSEDRRKLVTWNGVPPNHLEVEALPLITLEGTRQHKVKKVKRENGSADATEGREVDVEVIGIPEEHKADPTELYPFVLRWKLESDRRKCFVIGCEDETSRDKWVKNLTLYSNISKRHCGAFMWKLNADIATELPDDLDKSEAKEDLADIRNWRRRLCFLEQLIAQQSLCMTYISEKSDAEERVANTLASQELGNVASIRRIPQITVLPMTSREIEHVRVSVYQYDVAVSGPEDVKDIVLPSSLHGFAVRQEGDCQGQKQSIYAFGNADTCTRWIREIEQGRESLFMAQGGPP